ncbi:DUF4956 domain-containing protein [Clostridium vincentii]|uniref:Putative Mg(2+) transport ATPase n=1 Tax=Clostridium vincentii TaxID=52704 RepID=A0A2T0BI76_9CLOT|nr:DUF4956 domain-containing protein [Clostridium vincentii]PRR83561.1 putative Mg(2+) transport ATPase [Clostridium vincentii]
MNAQPTTETATTTLNDIFKSSFIEKASTFSILDTVIALALALAIGLFIFTIYKKTFNGVMYSSNFAVSLVAMTLITTLIILAVTSNVVLSLGMVGALSIVRFRSAIKEPMDIAYIFWSISCGIVLGAGLIPLAVFGSVVIGVFMLIFVNRKSSDNPYILVLNYCTEESEQNAITLVNKTVKKHIIKSKTVSSDSKIELTMEIRLNDMSTSFVNELASINGINTAVLVSYNGDYMG